VSIFGVFFLETSTTLLGTSWLVGVFDVLFIATVSVALALISAKSYLESGAVNILFQVCSFLVLGFGALAASWTSFSINLNMTILSLSILIASVLQVLSAVLTLSGSGLIAAFNRQACLAMAAIGAIFFTVSLTAVSALGYSPVFFGSSGPTLSYGVVFGLSASFIIVAGLVFGWLFFQTKSTTLFWYSSALGLMVFGLFGFLFVDRFGSVLFWVTRGVLYLSGLYFFAAIFDLKTKLAGVGFSEKWADAFRSDGKCISNFFAKTRTPFIYGKVMSDKDRCPVDCIILDVNVEFERVFGLSRSDVVGKKLTMVFRSVHNSPASWVQTFNQVAISGESVTFENYLELMKKWFSIFSYCPQKCYFVAVFEDITVRKMTESALRVNEEKYRNLFESMSEGFTLNEVLLDIEGKPYDYRILEVNAAQEKLMGLPMEKIIGQSISDLVPELAQKWIEIVGRVALFGVPVKLEEYNASLDKWLQFYVYSPKKGYCAIITADITERKKAEYLALEAMTALEKERDLFEAVTNGTKRSNLAYLDKNFNFVRVNKTCAKTSGYVPEEMIGKNFFELYPDWESKEIFQKVCETGQPVEFTDKQFIFPNQPQRGVTFWDYSLEPVKNIFGEVEGLVFSSVETTEHKRIEEDLRRSEANLAEAQQMAHMGSWEWDITTDEAVWSDEMFRIFNVKPLSPHHMNFLSWVHPDDLAGVSNVVSHCATTGQSISLDFRIIRPDGAERSVHMEAKVSSFDLSGKPAKLVGIMQDITRQKMLESELHNYAKNLERIVEDRTKKLQDAERLAAIGATAGMVGHDIRNPLQSITSDIYLIKCELANLPQTENVQEIKTCLDEIVNSVDYANKIVSDLQDYARPLMPKIEDADLTNITQSVISTVKVPPTITIHQPIPEDLPKLKIDQLYMRRILQNLTINAVQAMPNGGELTIAADVKDDKALIIVEDTGDGIPEEVRGRLFTPLFTTKSKGQGFGLAVVKRLTEAMAGNITFESEIGKGTRFIVELPINIENKGSSKNSKKNMLIS